MAESYRMAVDNSAIFSETDFYGNITHVNEMFCMVSGYGKHELIGRNHRILNSGTHDHEFFKNLWRTISSGRIWRGEICNKSKCGKLYWVHSVIVPMTDSATGKIINYASIRFDITDKKTMLADLRWRAFHDILTGLPNRALLDEHARSAIDFANHNKTSITVCSLDLDNFKEVNDAHGHPTGDNILIKVSNRILDVIEKDDMVARMGGDEFVIVFKGSAYDGAVKDKVCRIIKSISEPFYVNGIEIRVSTCAGLTTYPEDHGDLETLLRHSDHALYIAKQKGTGSQSTFDVATNSTAKTANKIVNRIRAALERGELLLNYQPKIILKNGEIHGFEALLRWNDPERGIIPPMEFLPFIENDNLIIEIGEWAIASALKQIKDWCAAGRKWSIKGSRRIREESYAKPTWLKCVSCSTAPYSGFGEQWNQNPT